MNRLAVRFVGLVFLLLAFSAKAKTQTQPTITAISPAGGAVGTWVTITGTNFGATQATVTFNGIAATPTSWRNIHPGACAKRSDNRKHRCKP